MKTIIICVLSTWLFVQEIPYKAKDEFEVNLKFEFKTRTTESNAVRFDEKYKTSGPLPYLKVSVKLLELSDQELRARVVNVSKENILSKKIETGAVLNFDLGFTDDLKGRTASHEYVVNLLNADKTVVTRIVIFFDEDGTYYINGEKRGKV